MQIADHMLSVLDPTLVPKAVDKEVRSETCQQREHSIVNDGPCGWWLFHATDKTQGTQSQLFTAEVLTICDIISADTIRIHKRHDAVDDCKETTGED